MDREGTKISCAGGTCSASECGEVVARYTNPDGTKKPGWMKAPNGKPTHLTERQWVQVRTPAFKAWFGDWEATAHATLRASASSYDEVRATLSALKGQIFTNTESGITATLSGNSIDKIVSGKAVNKSISLQAHLAAAANITDLFQYGKLLHTEAGTRKGITVSRKFYAPFFHGSETLVAKITVNEYEGEAHSRLYSIEAMEIERPSGVLAPKESHNESQAVSPHSANLQNTLQQMVGSVNPDTVSKVVDENGEPLVVYHGSPNVFNAFRKPEDGSGMYFSPWKEFASEYGNTRSFFLNIRNPIEYDEDFEAINDVEEGEADGHIYLPQDIEGEIRQDRVGETEIIAFSPSQIKSATDNVGTFSRKNKDTRYNVTTDAPVESALATQGEARDEEGTVLLTHTPSGAVRFNIETYHDYTDRGGLVHKGTRNALKDYMTLPYGTKDKPMPPRMTVEDFEEYIRPMDTMYKYIKEISDSGKFVNFTEWCQRQPDFKTEDGKTFYKSLSSLINNGDYPINIDLATDCVRRESYTELLNRLTQMPDVRLEKLDKVKIAEVNKLLRAYGLSTACDLCFVEAKRLGIVAWADNFIQQWNYALRQYEKKNGLPESQPAMYGSDKYEDALLNSSITSLPAARQMDAETRINELHSLLTQFPPIIKEGKGSGKDGALSKDDKDFNKAINSSKKAYEQISSKIKEYQKKSRDAWKKEHGTLDGYEESDKDRQEMDKIWSGGRKSVRAKMMQAIAKYPELRHPMTLNEMLGSRGLDAIRKTNGEAYSTLFSLILQSSGAGTPKPLQAETPYKGEVLDGVTESKVEKANAHGGARLQSFDDFKPIFIFDYLQMFMDLQSRDLTLQVYSKEIAFVELFGGATNAKINVSLLAEAKMPDAWKKEYFAPAKVVGKQKNGKPQYETKTQVDERRAAILKRVNSFAGLICDSNGKIARHPITGAILGQEMHGRHSAPLSRVMELHNDPSMNGDVAGITVGLSVNHIIYNILQSYNGMVIPYHASGMSREAGEQSDVFMYVDFTDSQNTRRWNAKKKGGAGWENANTAKRTFDEFNFYEGEDKPGWDMRTRVREYVDYCYNTKRGVDNGVKWAPKFDFIVNAKAYKAYCDENELEFVPEFYDAMKADCTLTRDGHEVWNGYYKVITDFCCYRDMDENGNMLEHEVSSPHKPIRLNWDILQERIKKMFSEDGSVAIREANKRYLAEHIDAITEKAKALINGEATLDEVLEGVDRKDKDLFNYNQVQKELAEHRAAIEKAEPLVSKSNAEGSQANVEVESALLAAENAISKGNGMRERIGFSSLSAQESAALSYILFGKEQDIIYPEDPSYDKYIEDLNRRIKEETRFAKMSDAEKHAYFVETVESRYMKLAEEGDVAGAIHLIRELLSPPPHAMMYPEYHNVDIQNINKSRFDTRYQFYASQVGNKSSVTKDDFFNDTIAYFDVVETRPDRAPDYVSKNYRTGRISSEYWYSKNGVIRGSDHWGTGIRSCDWALNGVAYGSTYGVTKTGMAYGFASWDSFVRKTEEEDTRAEYSDLYEVKRYPSGEVIPLRERTDIATAPVGRWNVVADEEGDGRANVFAEDRRNFDDDAPGSVRYMVDAEGNDVMAMSISWHWLRHIMAGAKQVETRPTKMVNYKGPLAGRTVYFYAPMTEYPSGKKSSFPLAGHLIGKATILDALPFKENGVVLESFKQRYRELKGVDFDESMMDLYPNDFGYILGDIQFLDKPIRAKSKNSRFFSPDETETSPEAMQALANIRQGIDPAIATAKQVEQAAEQARESWRYDITAYHGTSHDHERYHVAADEAIASASEGVTEKTLESAIRDIIENKRVAIKIDSPEEAEIILSGAMRFFREYSTRKIPLSTGSYLYFVPHPNAINRYNGDKSLAWAEYAIHAVTNDIFVNDKHMRKYNPQKCETIMPIIADIVAEDMASIEENGNVLFFKKLDNKHMGKVIARPVDSGNYEADLSEVTTSYTKGKFPANIMPLDRASKVNASKSGFSFTSTGPSSLPHRASVVQEGPVGDVLDYLSPDEERAIRRNVVADVRGD